MAYFVNKNVIKDVRIVLPGYIIEIMDIVYVNVKTCFMETCVIKVVLLNVFSVTTLLPAQAVKNKTGEKGVKSIVPITAQIKSVTGYLGNVTVVMVIDMVIPVTWSVLVTVMMVFVIRMVPVSKAVKI